MQRVFWLIVIVTLGMFSLTACSTTSASAPEAQAVSGDTAQHGQMEHNMEHAGDEHGAGMAHAHVDPPSEYAQLTNPFAGDAVAIAAGQTIFDTNCATCHGPQGQGDGLAATGLNPKPANLADRQMLDSLSDGYLFWRVSEGGALAPFNSAMPAWKATLSEEQRWQVISYLRSLGR
ncbi:MAG: cytochrome c [Anaerolineales bacterium]|nr:cytochrome c [Anaerolineales bacterium]